MADRVAELLARWRQAGVIDEVTADRILSHERAHASATRLNWPVWLALSFGGLLLAAGILLFVAANWDSLSPSAKFALVLSVVAAFHVGGAAVADHQPGVAAACHAVGTVALGAGIFLAGQAFNLEAHWRGGVMLWALGAAAGWAILREWPQMALAVVLMPAWLASEWIAAAGPQGSSGGATVLAAGTLLVALTYFTAVGQERTTGGDRVLLWVGGISLPPAALFAAVSAAESGRPDPAGLPVDLTIVGWAFALGVPLIGAALFRRAAAWANVMATAWVVALTFVNRHVGDLALYGWLAVGSMALTLWGVRDARAERVNMGSGLFAATVLAFYFSEIVDRLARSVSLVGLGVLFLAGGVALDRLRRRLVLQARSRHT